MLGEIEDIYATGVKSCVTAPLYPHEFEAFVRLAYSVGVPTFCRKAQPGKPPNLIDLINAERYADACARIEAFKYGPGRKVLTGLVKRRAEEKGNLRGETIEFARPRTVPEPGQGKMSAFRICGFLRPCATTGKTAAGASPGAGRDQLRSYFR